MFSNLQGHTFLETNEGEVKRSFLRLLGKFRLHNAPPANIARLDYLQQAFLKRPLKGQGDTTQCSVLRLLMLLQKSPTEEGAPMMSEGVPQARHYETKEEWHKRTWEGKVKELSAAYTMEDVEVERL